MALTKAERCWLSRIEKVVKAASAYELTEREGRLCQSISHGHEWILKADTN